jgi:hypothetical protein
MLSMNIIISFHSDCNKMAGKQKEKEPINIVHQNAILCETIGKEQRTQKLNTNYSVNPFKKSDSIYVYTFVAYHNHPNFRLAMFSDNPCDS